MQLSKWLGFFIVMSLIYSQNAYAYLDPGTGSYLFQILIAGLLAFLFFIKSIWRSIVTFISYFFRKKRNEK